MTATSITASIRAHRIFRGVKNYHKWVDEEHWLPELGGGQLGAPIGYYKNPNASHELVGIFEKGMAWLEQGAPIRLKFSEIVSADLPTEKHSEFIELQTSAGNGYRLPITGSQGKFLDSMHMIRFIDRCIADARNP